MNRGVRLIVGLGMILSATTALSSEMSQGAAAPSPDTVEMNRTASVSRWVVDSAHFTLKWFLGGLDQAEAISMVHARKTWQ